MVPSPSACHPWLAAGLIIYLAIAVYVSRRDFLRRVPSPPARVRDQWVGWARTSLTSFEPALVRFKMQPFFLTVSQLGTSLLAGGAYATGYIFLGGWLALGGGVLDILDGGLARRTARVSRRGAFLDSVTDRYAEFFIFCGLGILFVHSWLLWPVVLGFFGSMMVSYARARAEGLGVECQGGLMQRAERYVVLGVCSFLNTTLCHLVCAQTYVVLAIGLALLALLTNLTAIARVRAVAAALEKL